MSNNMSKRTARRRQKENGIIGAKCPQVNKNEGDNTHCCCKNCFARIPLSAIAEEID